VREALAAGTRIERILLHREGSKTTRDLIAEARRRGIAIEELPRRALDDRAGTTRHQGVVALLAESAERAASVGDILERAKSDGEPALVLLLDGIQDPQNLGALIRSAHAFGAHGVVIPKDRAAPLTAAAIKASAGAALHLPIARVTNIKHALDACVVAGLWTVAAATDGDPLESARLDGPIALVVGAEGKGVRPSVAARCDMRVRIDLSRGFDSLNASAAGAVLLYEIVRQRRRAGRNTVDKGTPLP